MIKIWGVCLRKKSVHFVAMVILVLTDHTQSHPHTHTHSTTIDILPHLISVQTSPHTLVLALRVCSVIHLSVYSSTCA